jgi:muconolactone delta-isomerase
MKFLVMWSLELRLLSADMMKSVVKVGDYAKKLETDGKLEARYHLVGRHGGAWIYKVASNEELDNLLALSPVYNFAHYDIYPLADMVAQASILQK